MLKQNTKHLDLNVKSNSCIRNKLSTSLAVVDWIVFCQTQPSNKQEQRNVPLNKQATASGITHLMFLRKNTNAHVQLDCFSIMYIYRFKRKITELTWCINSEKMSWQSDENDFRGVAVSIMVMAAEIAAVHLGCPDVFNSLCAALAMFASAVEASVEEADPLLQIVSVQGHHSVSHHLLLPD